jgi:hypothetical protein
MQMRKMLIPAAAGLVVVFGLLQLVPYGRNHTNPPTVAEPAWDSSQTRSLAVRACFDCHSNESVWPWYSNVAPVSWLVYRDVMEGRSRMNFSEWNRQQPGTGEITAIIQEGEMPPAIYTPMHPSARLTSAEKEQLITGLMNSLP